MIWLGWAIFLLAAIRVTIGFAPARRPARERREPPDECLSIDDLELLAESEVDGAKTYPMLSLHVAQCERCRWRLLQIRITFFTETE